ncbi:MAG: LysR family transcriptional regulator [Clostridiales bacterium]|nr:LysR family transcriptional regulator [Clostridiales bacterium]
MNTRHAQIILTILREGSFTSAARALYITQPTLSQTVKQIEGQLGEPIFVRGRSPLTLTPAGELYAQAARRILRIETQLDDAIRQLHGASQAALHIGMMPHRAGGLLPQVLADFRRSYPDIVLHVTSGTEESLSGMLERRELDMAFVSCEFQRSSLSYRQIASEEVVLLAGRQTALAQRIFSGSTIRLSEAKAERFVMPPESNPLHTLYAGLISQEGFTPQVSVVCDLLETARHCCISDGLVMLSPFLTLLCDSGLMPKLAHYHLYAKPFLPPLFMAHAAEETPSPAAEALFSLVSSRFRAMTAYRE